MSSTFQRWIDDLDGVRTVPLFDTDSNDVVRTRLGGRARDRQLLVRSAEMEAAMVDVITSGLEDEAWRGILYVMGWEDQRGVRPLYVGKAGRYGKTAGKLSANLTRISTDRGKFARWGDGNAYHIGDLSQALFGWSAYKPAGQKYERWAEVLFPDAPLPRLRFPTSLTIVPWHTSTPGPLGFPCTLEDAEEQAIDLAIEEFEDIVLNVAGETWRQPRARMPSRSAAAPTNPVRMITTTAELVAAVGELMEESRIGLDVETTMYEQTLCLVQIAGPTATFIIDPLTVDLEALGPLLTADGVEKVIHNSSFERRILGLLGFDINPFMDTLRRSRHLYGSGVSHRLDVVVGRELAIEIDKSQQSSRWCTRPLTPAQVAYAAVDAEILLPLAERLDRRDPQGRLN